MTAIKCRLFDCYFFCRSFFSNKISLPANARQFFPLLRRNRIGLRRLEREIRERTQPSFELLDGSNLTPRCAAIPRWKFMRQSAKGRSLNCTLLGSCPAEGGTCTGHTDLLMSNVRYATLASFPQIIFSLFWERSLPFYLAKLVWSNRRSFTGICLNQNSNLRC